jgi:hypothetical protein
MYYSWIIILQSNRVVEKYATHWYARLTDKPRYKIKIEPEKKIPLGYYFLYNQTNKKLKALKDYLEDNLKKRFIKNNSIDFVSFVLFIKKPNKSLRFCIDFCKFNKITKKTST